MEERKKGFEVTTALRKDRRGETRLAEVGTNPQQYSEIHYKHIYCYTVHVCTSTHVAVVLCFKKKF